MFEERHLFNHSMFIRDYLDGKEEQLMEEIKAFDHDFLRDADFSELIHTLVTKYQEEMVRIYEDKITVEKKQDKRTGDYILLYHIPFEGNPDFFRYRTGIGYTRVPKGRIEERELIFQIRLVTLDSELTKHYESEKMWLIKEYLRFAEEEVAEYNGSLLRRIEKNIEKRLKVLEKEADFMSTLGYPEVQKEFGSLTYPSSKVRRKLPLSKITTEEIPFEKEPILEMEEYDHILQLIETMGKAWERDPRAYFSLNETNLRTHILSMLNTHYDSGTSSETFNYTGKTDILIRDKGKNIFIGECAIWRGPKTLRDKIEQILDYTSWRDKKTAIILFCKIKEFSLILDQFDKIVEEHPNYVIKDDKYQKETQTRYILSNRNDKNKHFNLSILALNLYSDKEE